MICYATRGEVFCLARERYRMIPLYPEAAAYAGGGSYLFDADETSPRVLENFLCEYPPGADDIFAHVEITNGGADGRGVYIYNALCGEGGRRSFYPEMLFKHPFTEARGVANEYVNAARRFTHHNVYFFSASGGAPDIAAAAKKIFAWLDCRAQFKLRNPVEVFTEEESRALERVSRELRMTRAMREDFFYLAAKYRRRHGGFGAISNFSPSAGESRKDTKAAYGKLRERLVE